MTDQPIKNCYWVVPGKFLAGEYPRNADLASSIPKIKALEDAGVTIFIDLTEERDGLEPYVQLLTSADHMSFPIRDLSIPASPANMKRILDTIDQNFAAEHLVYLHCWGGVGRTGTVVGCWLARHGQRGQAALDRLRQLWQMCPKSASRSSPETWEQEQYVVKWDETR